MKKVIALLISMVTVLTLIGCGKEEVIDEKYQPFVEMTNFEVADLYYSKVEELNRKNEELEQLKQNYSVLSGEKNLMFEEVDMGDFSTRFEIVNDKLEINSKYALENLEKVVSNGTYFLTDTVQLVTSNNWYMKLSDNITTFNNEDGITVKIECYKVGGSEIYSNEQTEEELINWVSKFYNGSIKTNAIKSGQARVGTQATGKMMINGKEYTLRAGVIEIGTEFVRYSALYEANNGDNIKDEVITNLLNSLKINNNAIRVDA